MSTFLPILTIGFTVLISLLYNMREEVILQVTEEVPQIICMKKGIHLFFCSVIHIFTRTENDRMRCIL